METMETMEIQLIHKTIVEEIVLMIKIQT